jgi:8-oxo-dGTP pyrophosphatase MutT (NUDIX family)
MADWKTLDSKLIYENPWTAFREDTVLNPAGDKVTYGIVSSREGSAYVVPVDDAGNTYIVRQYRYPIQKDSWECIAGGTGTDSLEDGARRELLEEAGLTAEKLTPLVILHPATGRATYACHVYLATGITKVTDALDQVDGILELKRLPLEDVIRQIMTGEITCSNSIAAYMMAREHLRAAK